MLLMRFAMRTAGGDGATRADLYRAALEMAEWGEHNGCMSLVVSEHHAADDGYLPSPLVLASGMAAVTETTPVMVAALLVLFYEPVKLAEDMAVLDLMSRGRVSYTIGLGYRDEEFEQFGVDKSRRATLVEERIATLRNAWTGEPFDHDGRRVRVTPAPFQPGGPMLMGGGGTPAAARRAARLGMAFLADTTDGSLAQEYEAEAARVGVAPVGCMIPTPDSATVFVADDPDRAWRELGPYMLNDARAYAAWNEGRTGIATVTNASTIDELRADGAFRVVTPDEAVETIRREGMLQVQPLVGGIPPELAWPHLELASRAVTRAGAATTPTG